MTTENKYLVPKKLFNIIGASEVRQSRLMIALFFVIIVAVAVCFMLVRMNIELQASNRQLSSERVMYGFPNREGFFVSQTQIPRTHIEGFMSWFIDNYNNFTPESAAANANEALRLMAPSLRIKQEEPLKTVAQQSKDQQITQVFARETEYTIEFEPGVGYWVSFRGQRIRATLNRVFSKAQFDMKFLIKPVKPSAHFEWAVVVENFWAQEI